MNGPFRLLLPLGLAIVVIAALYRVATTAPRKRLRRSVILFGIYAAGLAASALLEWSGARAVVPAFRLVPRSARCC